LAHIVLKKGEREIRNKIPDQKPKKKKRGGQKRNKLNGGKKSEKACKKNKKEKKRKRGLKQSTPVQKNWVKGEASKEHHHHSKNVREKEAKGRGKKN